MRALLCNVEQQTSHIVQHARNDVVVPVVPTTVYGVVVVIVEVAKRRRHRDVDADVGW